MHHFIASLSTNMKASRVFQSFGAFAFPVLSFDLSKETKFIVFAGNAVADPGFSKWGGRCFVANGGAHILFSGKKCMKLKEIGLKWGGTRLLAPCYSKITIFL